MVLYHLFLLSETFPETKQLNAMEILHNGNLKLWHVCSLFTTETCKDSVQYFMPKYSLPWIITAVVKNFLLVMPLFINQSTSIFCARCLEVMNEVQGSATPFIIVNKPNVEAWSSTSESGASGTYLPFDWNWIALTISSIKLVNWCCLESSKSRFKMVTLGLHDGKGGRSRIFSMKKSRCKDVKVRAVGGQFPTPMFCV